MYRIKKKHLLHYILKCTCINKLFNIYFKIHYVYYVYTKIKNTKKTQFEVKIFFSSKYILLIMLFKLMYCNITFIDDNY